MAVSRVLSRIPRSLMVQCRTSVILGGQSHQPFSVVAKDFHSLHQASPLLVGGQVSLLPRGVHDNFQQQWYGMFSSASEKESAASASPEKEAEPRNDNGVGDSELPDQKEEVDQTKESGSDVESKSVNRKRRSSGTKTTAFSDSDSEDFEELSRDDLVKLVVEKEELLKTKQEELVSMKDKVVRTYAEMQNVLDRTKRDAENSKKFAVQNFAKGLLDVADNLQRASSVVKESYSKIEASKDGAGAVGLLKTLLEGVEMTDKQLAEVFKKNGVEKYDPTNEQFDPHRHNAVFEVPDGSKPPGTIAAVLKCGYSLYERIIRPAEVGVTKEVDTNGADKGVEA